jgi:hypothetical protein
MKNFFRIIKNLNRPNSAKVSLLLAAIAAIIGLLMTGCPEPDDDGNGGGRDEMKFFGQVYTVTESEKGITFQKFTGDLEIGKDYYFEDENIPPITLPGTGEIKAGILDYTIGKPPVYLATIQQMTDAFTETEMFENITASDNSVQYFGINSLPIVNSQNYIGLIRTEIEEIDSRTYYIFTEELVMYIYVEKNVTITGKGITENGFDYIEETPVSITIKSENLNLSLKAGWNAIRIMEARHISGTNSGVYLEIFYSISDFIPFYCKWTLVENDSADYSLDIRPDIISLAMRKNIRPVQIFRQLSVK